MTLWPRRFVIASALATLALPVRAEGGILSAPTATERVASGEILLLDIRSRQEWRETGLAEGALPVSMHEAGFAETLSRLLADRAPDEIALICATGGRSAHVARILAQNGVAGVLDVSEGMMGNPLGPGWLARKMPVVTLEQAEAALRALN